MTNLLGRDYYPKALLETKYCEMPIWYQGDQALLLGKLASIIGTRNISNEGILRTRRITKVLVEHGFCIVSGLAKGVDTVAHEATLQLGGATVAVMGTPIDECYPKENQDLLRRISEKGLVLSQFAPGSPVQKSNFPRRNALMAALTDISVVVEASEKSGTRHQVISAIAYGKKVGFLASLTEKKYSWITEALKSGNAFVINDPQDILREMNTATLISSKQAQQSLFVENTFQNDSIAGNCEPQKKKPIYSPFLHLWRSREHCPSKSDLSVL